MMKRVTAMLVFAGLSSALAFAADAPRRPRITGVAHIALYVHDMEKARAFYKDFLGLGEPFSLNKPDGELSMTFIKVNDRQYIELFPEVEAGSDRLHHISGKSRSEEHTSELQSLTNLVCRLLLVKKKHSPRCTVVNL